MLGGLWPLTQGRIYKPGGGSGDAEGGLSHDIFYVPQRPYVTQVGLVSTGMRRQPSHKIFSSNVFHRGQTDGCPLLQCSGPAPTQLLPACLFPSDPLQGSLQEQLIYPLPATAERRIPDDQLRQLLRTVDLEHLLDRWVGQVARAAWLAPALQCSCCSTSAISVAGALTNRGRRVGAKWCVCSSKRGASQAVQCQLAASLRVPAGLPSWPKSCKTACVQ